jgi:hypothetical protein
VLNPRAIFQRPSPASKKATRGSRAEEDDFTFFPDARPAQPDSDQAESLAWPPQDEDLGIVEVEGPSSQPGAPTVSAGPEPAASSQPGAPTVPAGPEPAASVQQAAPTVPAGPEPAASAQTPARDWRRQKRGWPAPRLAALIPSLRLRIDPGLRLHIDRETLAVGAFIALVAIGLGAAYRSISATRAPAKVVAGGALAVESQPAGAIVAVNGVPRGRTPLRLTLAPGDYRLEVRHGALVRLTTVKVRSGSSVSQYLELGRPAGNLAPAAGALRVTSEPSGATVSVDGALRGRTPLDLELPAGRHSVTLRHGSRRETREVRVAAGERVLIIASFIPPAPAPKQTVKPVPGYVNVRSSVPLNVFEGGELVGSTGDDRIALSAGTHTLELVNDSLRYRDERTVTIASGRRSTLEAELPEGTLSVNAEPWAVVLVDGRRLGETPIGRLALRIGRHEVVLRNPELGERRVTVDVKNGEPTLLSVDLRK